MVTSGYEILVAFRVNKPLVRLIQRSAGWWEIGEVSVVREKGIVKWFNASKGYGFIQRSTGEDVFVHHSSIQMSGYRTLDNGSEVEFEVKQGPKGLQAENVNRP
jgi:CspA family cold shock protein